MASTQTALAIASGNLVDLVSSSPTATIYPTSEVILQVLQARFRADLCYTKVGSRELVVINPWKVQKDLQPHIYQLASHVLLALSRTGHDQVVLARGVTGSWKNQLAFLSLELSGGLGGVGGRRKTLYKMVNAIPTILNAFTQAQISCEPDSVVQVVFWGLDKRPLESPLDADSRTYNVFYQFLAGATQQEGEMYGLEDPSSYALLASSGTSALKTLGFKSKHLSSLFSLLVAILNITNIVFAPPAASAEAAEITPASRIWLTQASRLLGVTEEDLEYVLTNRTCYLRKEVFKARKQRDGFVKDLWSLCVMWVVESMNSRLAIAEEDASTERRTIQILDIPGPRLPSAGDRSSTSSTLLSFAATSSLSDLATNFQNEVLLAHLVNVSIYSDEAGFGGAIRSDGVDDRVSVPLPANVDAGLELLIGPSHNSDAVLANMGTGLMGALSKAAVSWKKNAGGLQTGDSETKARDEELLTDFVSRFGSGGSAGRAFSVAMAGGGGGEQQMRTRFVITHFGGENIFLTIAAASPTTYSTAGLAEKDADILDPAWVQLGRGSSEAFVKKLFGDEGVGVRAQVRVVPLRLPNNLVEGEDVDVVPTSRTHPVSTQMRWGMGVVAKSVERTMGQSPPWILTCLAPNASQSSNSFGKGVVRAQLICRCRWPHIFYQHSLNESRLQKYVVEYAHSDFLSRFVPRMQGSFEECFRQCVRSHGWHENEDFKVGHRSVWIGWDAWKTVEDLKPGRYDAIDARDGMEDEEETGDLVPEHVRRYTLGGAAWEDDEGSVFRDPLTPGSASRGGYGAVAGDELRSPGLGGGEAGYSESKEGGAGEMKVTAAVEKTWWIPSFLMRWIGRMKRPDIRLAWREKFRDMHADLPSERADPGDDDWWAAVQGNVYDLSDFIHGQHSDSAVKSNTADVLDPLAGQDLTYYFPPPLTLGCDGLVSDNSMKLTPKNFSNTVPTADHSSGGFASDPTSALHQSDWYTKRFLPNINQFKKGPLVWDPKKLKEWAQDDQIAKVWGVYETKVIDLTDYFNTIDLNKNQDKFVFLNQDVTEIFQRLKGQDVSEPERICQNLNKVYAKMDAKTRDQTKFCLDNVFRIGQIDFRFGARCQVQNYFLIAASGILMASMVLKFLAALQLAPKRNPEMQDKFVICQVPCYTEGEDSLRRTIDSLSALNYDDKRKLIFVICDGNIIGSGNDKTTPRIVLDILGVDPKIDPEPLLFKSIGEGSKALNYGKVYSGLYEFEGHVVPYMVVVKVGKPTERSKPGNRGKRDSQILVMHYLNRVHFDAPMNPMELEIYHQMRNVIGIDPAFYEYIFTVDADTSVTPDSLNRLIASCADDASVIGICGETKVENEEGSWWTMIQVYEYYISHHLSKAFESLFGSVTCLPGCFSIYRIRTADKGRPIIISNRVIDEYAEPNVDTLHKKNLFSLGEDRFLTTLLMKHFPTFKTKFNPDAVAHTIAPDSFKILFSQRRRWINSTVHNLCELVMLPELFGFCCFSMRFFVFIDLLGTLILPATVVYLAVLIVKVALHQQALPVIALIMIAVTYGLQAVIFILKREFMLVGWMVVYLISYPVYSFFLPIYSFWCMDEFGWGNTRLVIGEGKEKKVIINEDEKFDDSMIPLKKFSEFEAEAWETGTRHSDEDTGYQYGDNKSRRAPRSRDESPHTYQQASQSGDYYRDTNALGKERSGGSQMSHGSRQPSNFQGLPAMPFGGGPGSVHGSDYGHGGPPMMPPMPFQASGSMYGMPMMPPQMPFMNPMGTGSFGGGSQSGFAPPPAIGQSRPMSTFSMATSVGGLGMGPSQNPNPTDDELFGALRNYLSTQDLMTVTKKTTRAAIAAKFPKADLSSRKDFLNQSIDSILSES
ncbi:chitin synthase [Flagelloscypha sp. PMI_526]|nr:chitin synthase [Flagelloscypha sp. PMI_526]